MFDTRAGVFFVDGLLLQRQRPVAIDTVGPYVLTFAVRIKDIAPFPTVVSLLVCSRLRTHQYIVLNRQRPDRAGRRGMHLIGQFALETPVIFFNR